MNFKFTTSNGKITGRVELAKTTKDPFQQYVEGIKKPDTVLVSISGRNRRAKTPTEEITLRIFDLAAVKGIRAINLEIVINKEGRILIRTSTTAGGDKKLFQLLWTHSFEILAEVISHSLVKYHTQDTTMKFESTIFVKITEGIAEIGKGANHAFLFS